MDKYEIAVLRVLLKNRDGIKISELVNGFPDDSTDFVLAAIESLRTLGYVCSNNFNEYLSLSREKRKEAISVVFPDYSPDASSHSIYPRKLKEKESSLPRSSIKSDDHVDLEDPHLFHTMLATITILGLTFVVLSSIFSQSNYISLNTLPQPQGQHEVYPAAIPLAPDQLHVIPQVEPREDGLVFFAMPPAVLENNNEPQSQGDVVMEHSFGEFSLIPQVEIIGNNLIESK